MAYDLGKVFNDTVTKKMVEDFVVYFGSVAQPDCAEKQTHIVLNGAYRRSVSSSRLEALKEKRLLNKGEFGNYRETQPLNKRAILSNTLNFKLQHAHSLVLGSLAAFLLLIH